MYKSGEGVDTLRRANANFFVPTTTDSKIIHQEYAFLSPHCKSCLALREAYSIFKRKKIKLQL